MPTDESASATAFTIAGGATMVLTVRIAFTPSRFVGLDVTMRFVSIPGRSWSGGRHSGRRANYFAGDGSFEPRPLVVPGLSTSSNRCCLQGQSTNIRRAVTADYMHDAFDDFRWFWTGDPGAGRNG